MRLKSSSNDKCKWRKNNAEFNNNKLKLRLKKMNRNKKSRTIKNSKCKREAVMELS